MTKGISWTVFCNQVNRIILEKQNETFVKLVLQILVSLRSCQYMLNQTQLTTHQLSFCSSLTSSCIIPSSCNSPGGFCFVCLPGTLLLFYSPDKLSMLILDTIPYLGDKTHSFLRMHHSLKTQNIHQLSSGFSPKWTGDQKILPFVKFHIKGIDKMCKELSWAKT